MPELARHLLLWLSPNTPTCKCGWNGTPTKWEAEARGQFTEHLRSVGALTEAGKAIGMRETDAEAAATNLARHVP